ncbi:hypothetical protein B9Z55_025329 [Caenorhabditis nigoni]|uniref:Uncharacterized protein n=1 Tax=Caenorhabditis nigoni TaxID=1611254 RepID=A0A2G5SY68_9PELO|nr:hypothetical protein B9Z55_025329 [Caenorhabditis nigoni]
MNDMGDVFEDTYLEIDDAETSSTIVTDADKIQPQSKWRDPFHMPQIHFIDKKAPKKMMDDNIREIRREHTEFKNSFQPYPTKKKAEHMELIR